jgi:hypothetical protein
LRNNRGSTDSKASTNTDNPTPSLSAASLSATSLPQSKDGATIIISDNDDGNDDTHNRQDDGENADDDRDISSATCDNVDDEDFEMTDFIDEEEESDDEDSDEANPGSLYGEKLHEVEEDEEWLSQRSAKASDQEQDTSKGGNVAEEEQGEQGEQQQQEEEENLYPQPVSKRPLAEVSTATYKRAKLSIPTTSRTLHRAERRNPGNDAAQGIYLVSTITQPLQAIPEAVGSNLAVNNNLLPVKKSLGAADR